MLVSSPVFAHRRWSLALLAPSLLAGCQSQDDRDMAATLNAAASGSVKADLQRHFDSHPQCALVLSTDRPSGVLSAPTGSSAARALVAARLIEPVRPGNDGVTLFRPAATAAKWFRKQDDAIGQWLLCYATRQIVSVLVDPNGTRARLRYSFNLRPVAPWVSTPDMTRAFPPIAGALDGGPFLGIEPLHVKDGRLANVEQILPTDKYLPFHLFNAAFGSPVVGGQ